MGMIGKGRAGARKLSTAGGGAVRRIPLLAAAMATVLAAFAPGPAAAGGLDIVTRYYSVTGRSHAELVASVRRNAPRAGGAYGIGFIDFSPRYRTAIDNGKCRIAEVQVGVRVALTLPQWRDPGDAPGTVARQAARFVRAIDSHERTHAAIAGRFARTMKARLVKIAPSRDCWTLRERAEALIREVKKQHGASQRAFDLRTKTQIRRLL
jgi:predicted secreted Zn-dependent protease